MKRTTERLLILLSTRGREQDWKRLYQCRMKSGVIVRGFENRMDREKLRVFEYKGTLYWENPRLGYGWLFAIVDNEDGGFGVWVTRKKYWEKRHCVDDRGVRDTQLTRALNMYGVS